MIDTARVNRLMRGHEENYQTWLNESNLPDNPVIKLGFLTFVMRSCFADLKKLGETADNIEAYGHLLSQEFARLIKLIEES